LLHQVGDLFELYYDAWTQTLNFTFKF